MPGKSNARIFGHTLVNKGLSAAMNSLNPLKSNSRYDIFEEQFNQRGHDLMRSGKLQEAIAVFKVNTELYPDSYNAFDGYGEVLLKDGQKSKALKMYQRGLWISTQAMATGSR